MDRKCVRSVAFNIDSPDELCAHGQVEPDLCVQVGRRFAVTDKELPLSRLKLPGSQHTEHPPDILLRYERHCRTHLALVRLPALVQQVHVHVLKSPDEKQLAGHHQQLLTRAQLRLRRDQNKRHLFFDLTAMHIVH